MKTLLTSSVFIIFLLSSPTKAESNYNKEHVLILHGILLGSSHMESLENHLIEEGYIVHNIDYPSIRHKIEELVEIVGDKILAKKIEDKEKVHMVGFSMGGLIVRAILNGKYRPKNLGRVVLLGTPNKGSEVADFWNDTWIYKKIFGDSGQQLGVEKISKIQPLFSDIDYELGVIAGNFSIDPFSSYLIEGQDDGKVSVESTKVKGMKDHIVVNASHTFFPHNDEVKKLVSKFLREGNFVISK